MGGFYPLPLGIDAFIRPASTLCNLRKMRFVRQLCVGDKGGSVNRVSFVFCVRPTISNLNFSDTYIGEICVGASRVGFDFVIGVGMAVI